MADPIYNNGAAIFFLCLCSILGTIGLGLTVGGAGGLHADCDASRFPSSCADTFRPIWWAACLEAGVLFAAFALTLAGTLGHTRVAVSALVAVASLQLWSQLEAVLQLYETDPKFYVQIESREEELDVVMAGLIMLSMVNLVLVVVLGFTGPRPSAKGPAAAGAGRRPVQAAAS
ncbi:unnamed protein product [Ostreobium quekettii]|uniref:Uncharacterized protein n=1 Tax=Ostreobium quekettii TaxID=121088 RepID=A0A8S1IY69_9CHLO|nr:unnamed protein product [Ostreobium quekettii]|eukprot:evm.model.scf_2170.3 EVM.evm.TU.scf_2170.3   scf_2170:13726-14247(+)